MNAPKPTKLPHAVLRGAHKTIVARTDQLQNGFTEPVRSKLNVYPNPTTGIIHLDQAGPSDIEVRDGLGRSVKTFNAVTVIDIGDLPNGIYLLCINAGPNREIHTMLLNK